MQREGLYLITKIISGEVVERRKSYVGRKLTRRGARIKGNSSERKQEGNVRSAMLALARVLNCNFSHGDALLTLNFGAAGLEECGGTIEGATKLARNFIDRMARRMKKHGDVLKWVLVPSERSGETGEAARVHVHLVVSGHGLRLEEGEFYLYDQKLNALWGRGTVDVQVLRHQKDYYPLAVYLIRQARRGADEKKYSVSRNMVKPRIERTYVTSAAQLRAPAGATVLPGTRFDPEHGVNVVRYLRRVKTPELKVGGHRELALAMSAEAAGDEDGDGGGV